MKTSSGIIQTFIKKCNLFTSPVNFRYKLEQDYNTFAGGLISIFSIILLMCIFYGSWMSLINKTEIFMSSATFRDFDPTHLEFNSNDFMFGIGINGMNLSNPTEKRYFDFSMKKVQVTTKNQTRVSVKTPFTLEACQQKHWQHLGQVFVERYNRLNLSSFLCPPKNTSMQVGGKWTSPKFTYFQIRFDRCKGDNCRTQAEVDDFIKNKKSFEFDFFYSNTLLNPDQIKPVSMLLEDKDYALCSPKLSTSKNMYIEEYSMTTDESIFPWDDEVIKSGFVINRVENEIFNSIPTDTDPYYRLYIRKSDSKIQIDRKFRKLDDMLSYIGGLLGIIVLTLGFVVKYYGQCAFQLEMCQKIFDYHNKKQSQEDLKNIETTTNEFVTDLTGNKTQIKKPQPQKVIEPKDFGFLDFILHIILYIPLKRICRIKWKKMEVYEESLEEMRYKLDISQLLEKLNFYDRSINALFDENQLKLLYLQDKFQFQEVREERKMLSLREDINIKLSEEKEIGVAEESDNLSIKEYKKSLKEIAQFKSRKNVRERTKLKNQNIHLTIHKIDKEGEAKHGNMTLPLDIKRALQKLDTQIEKGDLVSIRIYNGLQYELLQAYQKSKSHQKQFTFIPVTMLDYQNDIKRSTMNSIKLFVRSFKSINENDRSKSKDNKYSKKDCSFDSDEGHQ